MLRRFYTSIVLVYPRFVLLIVFIAVTSLGYQASKLEIDASAETLALQDDKDLEFMRTINTRYGNSNFLIIAYTPDSDLLSDKTLKALGRLSDELLGLDDVVSVTSILNVPLLESPSKPVKELLEDIPTLASSQVDKVLAKEELLSSPLYSNNLVSPDFKTTALLVGLHDDERYKSLLKRRNSLLLKEREQTIKEHEQIALEQVRMEFKAHRDKVRESDHQTIVEVRAIMDGFRDGADLFLGGVSMIADDMIGFVKYDLKIYGTTALLLIMSVLWIVFRQLRWVFIPVLIASLSVIATAGLLGMFGWEVTVISSNFISLQLIITMSLIIHLMVRYRELMWLDPHTDQHSLVLESVLSMARPCSFAVVTTIAGFGSLIVSGILPVINLGWMMGWGIAISLLVTFLVFPAVLILLKVKPLRHPVESRRSLTKSLATFTQYHGKIIFGVSLSVLLFALSGAAQLRVENSFIDYFKQSTEIYQGMLTIDEQLGGTTPLDIIVDFSDTPSITILADSEKDMSLEEDDFDAFEAEFSETEDDAQYWFTSEKMEKIEKIHDYLESIPEVGKVLSLGTMLEVGRHLNNCQELDNFQLALLYNELPDEFRKVLLDPYLSIEEDQARFVIRVIDSNDELRRDALIKKIKSELVERVGVPAEDIRLSNMMLLYNNMLQSLFESQILTLGIVVLILSFMFFILFRSLKVVLIAMIANLLPVSVIFGLMGWASIPLDMMTITIAAISVGIAVDNTIHYIHRYKIEFARDSDYIAAMHRAHNSIGYAMYYTSVAIMIGFSVLVLSNFIPTIYFGLLTALAMLMALLADLLLLPRLIIAIRPFK